MEPLLDFLGVDMKGGKLKLKLAVVLGARAPPSRVIPRLSSRGTDNPREWNIGVCLRYSYCHMPSRSAARCKINTAHFTVEIEW